MAAQTYAFHRRGGAHKANTIAATANPAMSERELVANTEKTDRIAVAAATTFVLPRYASNTMRENHALTEAVPPTTIREDVRNHAVLSENGAYLISFASNSAA